MSVFDKKPQKNEPVQLSLGLRTSPFQFTYKWRDRLYLLIKAFEAKRYFRDPLVWLFICLMTTALAVQITYLLNYYDSLPNVVPFLQTYLPLDERLIAREAVLGVPIVSFILLVAGIAISSRNFARYKIVSTFTLYYVMLSNSLLAYILINLFAIYNVG